MEEPSRIDLAHAEPFRLGRLAVRPQLRQLARDDGAEQVIEPRVMQVLVALARADGAILSRDDLTRCCWEGRVVGEDAINRVISRLRRVAEGIGAGGFRVETVTKVGYRLVRDGQALDRPVPTDDDPHATIRQLRLDRRAMLIGSGLAVVTVGGGLAWRRWSSADEAAPPADVAPLMLQARIAASQGTAEGGSQALGLMRRVTELRPDYADGWGLLAVIYAGGAGGGPPATAPAMRLRAEQAIRRTFQLDPGNPYARIAESSLKREQGRWREEEALAQSILRDHPRNDLARGVLCGVLLAVGRCAEGAEAALRLWESGQPDPSRAHIRIVALWSAGRLEEADKAAAEAAALFPTHFAVWFSRFYLLLYSGRPAEALAMSREVNARPPGLPGINFTMIEQVAQALISHAPADIDRAIATNMEAARRGAGFAENTMQFAAALGRLDTAFEVAQAYYFGRGFDIGELRYQPEQRVYTRRTDRRTRQLFMPSTAPMRADPRFAALVRELELERYWAETGTLPDYRRG